MISIDAATALYGIIGHPVRHSLSPLIHNLAFKRLGINAVYLAFDVTDLRGAIAGVKALGIKGLSVTIPHKTDIIPLLDGIDEVVSAIGAVNTVINQQNKLFGTNTDWLGVTLAIKEKGQIGDKTFVVLGAGGAARAVVYGLKKKGAKVFIANRTYEKAVKLAQELGVTPIKWEQRSQIKAYGLVNATSVGMWPKVDDSPMPKKALEHFNLVMDVVYNPLETRLLKDAKAVGCLTVDGLKMLIYQGVEQFRLWTKQQPPVNEMLKKAKEVLNDRD